MSQLRQPLLVRIVALVLAFAFVFGNARPVLAQALDLPEPGRMLGLSPAFSPAMIRGLTVDPQNPFVFQFLMDRGSGREPDKEMEYEKIIRYFLASLAIPEKDLWVNLSPYEKGRIIADNFGSTEMGRDLLAQDYVLKQVTASLIHPDDPSGRAFWDKVYQVAGARYSATDMPVDAFNKVWIMPDAAEVYEQGQSVILTKFHLKVMLESDWAMSNNGLPAGDLSVNVILNEAKRSEGSQRSLGCANEVSQNNTGGPSPSEIRRISERSQDDGIKKVLREVVIPILEKEVNEGRNFAQLRQITAALILATWYKGQGRTRLLNQNYSDRSRVRGVDQDPANNQKIYQKYVEAFKKGVFNFIREDVDALSGEPVPRKYFSGGYSTVDEQGRSLSARIGKASGAVDLAGFSGGDEVDVVFQPVDAAEHFSRVRSGVNAFDLLKKDAALHGRQPMEQAQVLAAMNDIFSEHFKYFSRLKTFKWVDEALGDSPENRSPIFSYITGKLRTFFGGLYDELDDPAISRQERFGLLRDIQEAAVDAVSFIQTVLMNSSAFNAESSAMTDLLTRQGWDDQTLSMMTVFVADMCGIRDVSVIEMDVDDFYLKYPLNGVGRFGVLVRSGDEVAVVSDGISIFPLSVMVTRQDEDYPMPANFIELGRDPFLYGLDMKRMSAYIRSMQKFKALEKEMRVVLTHEFWISDPGGYQQQVLVFSRRLNDLVLANPVIYSFMHTHQDIQTLRQQVLGPQLSAGSSGRQELLSYAREFQEELSNYSQHLRMLREVNSIDLNTTGFIIAGCHIVEKQAFRAIGVWQNYLRNSRLIHDLGFNTWVQFLEQLRALAREAHEQGIAAENYYRQKSAGLELERVNRHLKGESVLLCLAVLERTELYFDQLIDGQRIFANRHGVVLDDVARKFVQDRENLVKKIEQIWDLLLDSYNEIIKEFKVMEKDQKDVVAMVESLKRQSGKGDVGEDAVFHESRMALAGRVSRMKDDVVLLKRLARQHPVKFMLNTLDAVIKQLEVFEKELIDAQIALRQMDRAQVSVLDNVVAANRLEGIQSGGSLINDLGGIDLDPNNFTLKTRGSAAPALAGAVVRDAPPLQGLSPRIMAIRPAAEFLRAFDIK